MLIYVCVVLIVFFFFLGYNKNSICKELCEVCDEYFPTRLICYENLLQHICLDGFSLKVEALNTSDLCVWDKIKW